MTRFIFTLIYFLVICATITAQTVSNPFDLTPRIKEAAKEQKANQPFVPANPFDIKRSEITNVTFPNVEENTIAEELDVAKYENPELVKEGFRKFVFIVIMSILVLLTVIFTLFRHNFIKAWRSFLNDNMLRQVNREQGVIAGFPYLAMNFLFFINVSLLVIMVMNYFNYQLPYSNWVTLLVLFIAITFIFLIKHLILKIVSSVFPLSKEMRLYAFTITIFCSILGILLIPLNILIAYLPEDLTLISIWGTLGIITIIYLFRTMRGFFIGGRYLATNQFHFLLYICAVEIAPTLILLRFILNQA